MGSTTYRWILDHEKLLESGKPWPYTQPCWVFTSRDLPAVPGAEVAKAFNTVFAQVLAEGAGMTLQPVSISHQDIAGSPQQAQSNAVSPALPPSACSKRPARSSYGSPSALSRSTTSR